MGRLPMTMRTKAATRVWTRRPMRRWRLPVSRRRPVTRPRRMRLTSVTLSFMPQSAAGEVYKVVASALANAEQNEGLEREDMWISEIYADEGPLRKWRRFGARGRFKPILKRSSHITVVLEERLS